MKLLSVSTARVIWNFYTKDLNPRGRYIAPPVFKLLKDKYNFAIYPKTIDEMDEKKGIQFREGEFTIENGESIQVALAIYDFGVVADTRSSTVHTEAFIKDAIDMVVAAYNLPSYESIIRSKSYVSELYVKTEKSLDTLNPKLQAFTKKLNKHVTGHGDMAYEASGIQFWNDPSLNSPFPFRLERQESIGFKENRYYAIAPLATDTHIELLNDLEDILK